MAFRIPWSVFLIPKRKIPGSTSKNYSDSGGEKLELREELLSTPPSAKIRIVFQANSVQVATNKSSIVSQKMPGLICHRLEFKSSIVLNSMSKATQPFPPPPPNPHVKGNGKTVMDSGFHAVESRFQVLNSSLCQWNLGRFPFVRTDRPDHFPRNEKFHLWSKLSSEVSQILNSMHEGDGFSAKTLLKKPISYAKLLVRQWSGRPVLTNGKRP